jgi:hypothetical protein
MRSDSKQSGMSAPPQLVAMLEPAVLVLAGTYISVKNAASTPVYHLSRNMDTLTHKDTSIYFECIEYNEAPGRKNEEVESIESAAADQKKRQRLYCLVHPLNAKYRTDIPAYYMTSHSADLPGNVRLESSKKHPLLRKKEFKALLSVSKTATSPELFDDEKAQHLLFEVKPRMLGGGFMWTDSDGKEVAREDGKSGGERSLAVAAPMSREKRDALVALWVLRLWHDIAKERHFTREGE